MNLLSAHTRQILAGGFLFCMLGLASQFQLMRLVPVTLCLKTRFIQSTAQTIPLGRALLAFICHAIQRGQRFVQAAAGLVSRFALLVLLIIDFAGFLVQRCAALMNLLQPHTTGIELGTCITELTMCLIGLDLQFLAAGFHLLQFATSVFETLFQPGNFISY
jgi:hypothetical protein